MTKVKPTTKEQLVYHLLNYVSLGTYDKRFLSNLQALQLNQSKPATSNQSDLLDKITLRYAKQLRRKEIDANDMVKLPWGVEPIESLPEYTDAFCTIKDTIVEVRSPYKKEFISDIKETPIHLNWNKETKIWSADVCEESLKHFINCLDKHYQNVHYCPETVKVINTMAEYETATVWDPCYMKVNNNYMIAGINESLYEAVKNIPMDLEPSTLARLSSAGIEISNEVVLDAVDELWNTDEAHHLIDFAISATPTIDVSKLANLVSYLKEIACDYVIIVESFSSSSRKFAPNLVEMLESKNIAHMTMDRKTDVASIDTTQYDFPIIINTALWGTLQAGSRITSGKTVFLGNSKPVEVK